MGGQQNELSLRNHDRAAPERPVQFGRTCQPFFDKATGLNRRKEVELKIGTGHAVLYQPLKEWIDLVEEWARQPAP